ncbi:MAG TPA: phosphotyrosine protein phosphatase [Thiomicrospira sp.]|nr:phosphotyrosine protein phosphatase [Thiomicrospira sp.]
MTYHPKQAPLNILFVCSRNQWRSPTAEKVWRNHPAINVRSAGTSPHAKRTLKVNDIRWADKLLVMEQKHKNRIVANFTNWISHKPIYVLDIPDDYQFMDNELVELVKVSVAEVLNLTVL